MEIYYGNFECIVELPEGYCLAQASASYANGFLRVDVPALLRPPLRRIAVPIVN